MTIAARSVDKTLGEVGLSSSGLAVAYAFDASGGSEAAFTAPIEFNQWHHLSIEMDFSGETTVVLYYLDGELLGAMPTENKSNVLQRGALVVYALPDSDGDERAGYIARFDNFRVTAQVSHR